MPLNDDPRWACNRKKAYVTERYAKEVARRARETRGVDLWAYSCSYCGSYHVGKHALRGDAA